MTAGSFGAAGGGLKLAAVSSRMTWGAREKDAFLMESSSEGAGVLGGVAGVVAGDDAGGVGAAVGGVSGLGCSCARAARPRPTNAAARLRTLSIRRNPPARGEGPKISFDINREEN